MDARAWAGGGPKAAWRLMLAWGACGLLGSGCFTPPAGACEQTSDCRDGWTCEAGRCQDGTVGGSSGAAGSGSSTSGGGGSSGVTGGSTGGSTAGSTGGGSSAVMGSSQGGSSAVVSSGGGSSSGAVGSSSGGALSGSSGTPTVTPDPVLRTLSDTANPQAFFALPAGTAGTPTFTCAVDTGNLTPCNSPLQVTGLAMHQEATVRVKAQLPGLAASNEVTRVVRRGFKRRGVGGGTAYEFVALPGGGWLLHGSMRGVDMEVSPRLYAPLVSTGALDTSRTGLVTGGYSVYGEGVLKTVTLEHAASGEPTGNLYVGGTIQQFNGVDIPNNLLKLTRTGAQDTTFAPVDVGDNGDAVNVVLEDQATDGSYTGKLWVAGRFNHVGGNTGYRGLVKLRANGTPDPGWPANGGFDDDVDVVLLVRGATGMPTGQLLVGGNFTTYAGAAVHQGLVLLNSDGTLDSTFAAGNTGFDRWVSSLLQLRNAQGMYENRFVVGGAFTLRNGVDVPDRLVVMNLQGTLDPTFNPGGQGIDAYTHHGVYSLLQEEDTAGLPTGRVWVGGEFWDNYNGQYKDGNLFRVNLTDGTLDRSAVPGVYGPVDDLVAERASDGKPTGRVFVVGGLYRVQDQSWSGVAVLDSAMMLDPAFGPAPVREWELGGARALVQDRSPANGAWLPELHLVGGFMAYSARTPARHLVRLAANGDVDMAFAANQFPGFERPVNAVAPELAPDGTPTGAVIAVGGFYQFGGQDIPNGIARITAAGTRDATFNAGGYGFDSHADAYAIAAARDATGMPTGAFWVGGPAADYNTNTIPAGLFRIQANGRRDATYNPGAGFGWSLGTERPAVGYMEAERAVGTGAYTGKLLVTGRFDSFNGQPLPVGLARLLPDGTPDPSFAVGGTGFAGSVEPFTNGVAQELDAAGKPNGRLLVYGRFDTFHGVARESVVRLLEDGSVDTSFGPVGFSGSRTVYAVLQERDASGLPTGNWFLGGNFGSLSQGSINVPDNFIRVTSQGQWDPVYATDAQGFTAPVFGLAYDIRPGVHRVLVAGDFFACNGLPRLGLAALDAQGNPDEYFHGQGSEP